SWYREGLQARNPSKCYLSMSTTTRRGEPRGCVAVGGDVVMIYLGLGSNLGDRRASLARAIGRLEEAGARVVVRSGRYPTEPVEVKDQQEFINQVVGCETALSPAALLAACLGIERDLGRVRDRDKGPRTIDLDLLLYGDRVLSESGLVV